MTVWLKHGRLTTMLAAAIACCSCGFHHTKYENPITKDTQQPDKLLYDKAVKDLSKGRYEMARLTLNTLINTYDTSEYLAKAKLAIAAPAQHCVQESRNPCQRHLSEARPENTSRIATDGSPETRRGRA